MIDPLQKNNTLTLNQIFEHGVSLYQHQKKKEARSVFEKLLPLCSDPIPVLQVLAVLDTEDGNDIAALDKIEKALSVSPKNHSLLYDKANLLTKQGKNKEALAIVESLLSLAPENIELLSLQQQLNDAIGLKRQSLRITKQKEKLKSQIPKAFNDEIEKTLHLAHQMVNCGNMTEAKQLFEAVISVGGDLPPALLGLAKLHMSEKKYALARQILQRAIDNEHPNKDVIVLLSHCEIKIEQFKIARNYARLGQKLWPQDVIFYQLLAQTYQREKNWLEAYQAIKKVINSFPDDADLLYRLATSSFNLLRQRHNFTSQSIVECQHYIERAALVASNENKYRLTTYLAELLWYKGEALKAKSLLEDYISHFPEDIEAKFNISFIYRTLELWKDYYRSNEQGLICGRRLKYRGNMPQWDFNRPKDDIVLVMPEQGVGDEILYFHNLDLVLQRAKKVYVACDPRLKTILSLAYPKAIMIPMVRIENEDIHISDEIMNEVTCWIAGGSLAAHCFYHFGKHIYKPAYIRIPNKINAHWLSVLSSIRDKNKKNKLIGICWRSGLTAATRNMHYLASQEVAYLLKQFPDAIFVNLQYGDCQKELNKIEKRSGYKVIQLEGLDLRNDFTATAAVIANLDAVITAGTAVHRLTAAVGTPCHVFFSGTNNSDFSSPKLLNCENEFGYFYPPMLENKYPMLEFLAANVKKHLQNKNEILNK